MPSATAEDAEGDEEKSWWMMNDGYHGTATKLYPDVETYINNVLFDRGTEISQIYTSAWFSADRYISIKNQNASTKIQHNFYFKSIQHGFPHGLVFRM